MANPWLKKPLAETPKATPELEIKAEVREALASHAEGEKLMEHMPPQTREGEDPETHIERNKLSRLVDDNFPFDESQIAAIDGMTQSPYACLTGAAGTGKTTTTKKLVDTLQQTTRISEVDMREYWKKAAGPGDADDDYEMPESYIPAIALVGFTGRSSQMIKKNFPRDWHGNIMTIHRLLGFFPEFYEAFDEETQELRKKMRFVPTYNESLKMPWDIVIIDEAGMVGLDLWNQLWAACKDGCKVYMIGDINQLPPVHGRSIFGFAMSRWPSFELTHIHRQQGADNEIVDNAWRILRGELPRDGGKFSMIKLDLDAQQFSRKVRAIVPELRKRGIYDPIRDSIITAINGQDGQRGYALGQLPLNQEFAIQFNPKTENPRFVIDGGREKKYFAIGDKVMATKNDYESGITNGMTGLVVDITAHSGYGGDIRRFGSVDEVNKYYAEEVGTDDEDEFSLEELESDFEAKAEASDNAKENRERGPSSHIVTVRFGTDDHGFEIPFQSLSEVGSLMTAYVVTCHKMQGGESPVVIIICHDSHKQMMYREWLYTAVTRASEKCILIYSTTALRAALNKQRITGRTLKEKIHAFNLLQRDNGLGASVNVVLPDPPDGRRDDTALVPFGAKPVVTGDSSRGLDADLAGIKGEEAEAPAPRKNPLESMFGKKITIEVKHTHTHEYVAKAEPRVVEDTVRVWPPARVVVPEQKRVNEEVSKRPKLENAAEEPWAWPAEWSEQDELVATVGQDSSDRSANGAGSGGGSAGIHPPVVDRGVPDAPKVSPWLARIQAARRA